MALRPFILVLIVILSVSRVHAISICPYPQHEVSFGLGALSVHQMGVLYNSGLSPGILKDISRSEGVKTRLKPAGPFFLTYKFFYHERLSVGLSLLYTHNKISNTYPDNKQQEAVHNTLEILPRMDFYYVRKPNFAMYGMFGVGIGAHFLDSPSSKQVAVAYQVSPICFRFGHKVGVVMELGFGALGVANAGVGYRHYKRYWN